MREPVAVESMPLPPLSVEERPGARFVCEACPCGELTMQMCCVAGAGLGVLASCPHMDIVIVGEDIVSIESKGVRH